MSTKKYDPLKISALQKQIASYRSWDTELKTLANTIARQEAEKKELSEDLKVLKKRFEEVLDKGPVQTLFDELDEDEA